MRWLALAVSLIASVILIIHNVIVMLLSPATPASSVTGLPGNGFTLFTGVLLIASAILALIGGILAFNRRRLGGFFLIVAAAVCFFAHRDTRIYGALYLVGGILSFFVKPSSPYEDYDYDDEDDEGYDDDDEEVLEEEKSEGESFRGISYGARRKERSSRVTTDERKEYTFRAESEPEPEKIRVRSSKVCPDCGASVGVDHKFCFICGGPLHTARTEETDSMEPKEFETVSSSLPEEPAVSPAAEEAETFVDDFKSVLLKDSRDDFSDREMDSEDDPDDRLEGDDYEEEDYEEDGEEDEAPREITTPHKVFVKPQRDDQPVPRRPFRVNPDNSYQEFSNYTRRRKRRTQSMSRRIVGLLLLLFIVGGSAWFLLGLRRGPLPEPPTPQPDPVVTQEQPEDGEGFAVPEPGPTPPPTNGLPAIQIASPTRGVVTGSNVNVRSDHSTSGTVVTRLNTDARAELLDTWQGTSGNLTGPWYQIRSGGKEGWIYGQYFQLLDGRETTLPAGYTAELLRSFGTDKTGMIDQIGQPTRRSATSLTWSGMVATFKGDSEVTRLQITGGKHTLKNGVAVGMTEEALVKNLGHPSEYKAGQLRYLETPNQGIAIKMKDGKVQSITAGNI